MSKAQSRASHELTQQRNSLTGLVCAMTSRPSTFCLICYPKDVVSRPLSISSSSSSSKSSSSKRSSSSLDSWMLSAGTAKQSQMELSLKRRSRAHLQQDASTLYGP